MAIIVTGTAFCDKNTWYQGNNANFSPSKINDGGPTTRWIGAALDSVASLQNFCGLKFTGLQDITAVVVSFASWGNSIRIGTYAPGADPASASFTKADIIPLQTFTAVGGTDADGKAITINTDLRFVVNATQIPGIIMYCDSNANSSLTNTPGNVNTNESINELVIHGAVQTVLMGINPKPPATVPVLPFSATPTDWVRTEYNTAGDFNFTPAADTTLLLAIVQGSGSGGRVTVDLNGNPTTNDSTLNGGASTITTDAGLFLTAPGGIGIAGGTVASYVNTIDWLREIDTGSRNGSTTTTSAAPVGAQSFINGTVGAAYTLAAQQTNFPATAALNTFTGTAALSLTPVYFGSAFRSSTNGLSVVALDDSVTLTFKGVSGQQLTTPFINTGTTQYTVTLNGTEIDAATASSNFSRTYTLTTTGDQTLIFKKVNGTFGTLGIGSITFSNYGQGGAISGGSGRTAQAYIVPKALSIHVGAGGIGQAGGQSVTAAQNGLRGSGGAPGGNGGAGVVVIYEFKGSVLFETPVLPLFPNYNNVTAELAGVYRTNYIGSGVATKQNYVHKLRPRTKRAIVLMVGAGGGVGQIITAVIPAFTNDPAIVSAGTKTFTAGSGASSYRVDAGSGNYPSVAGVPGEFSSTNGETIFQQNGTNTGNASASSSGVVNNYGSSVAGVLGAGNGINNSTWSGGSGSSALFVLGEEDLTSREISIQVPGAGQGGYDLGIPGAVFIFETESDFGYATTQNAELILTKSAVPATQVTQTSELILQKSAAAQFRTTQVAELVLVKDSDAVDLQVANVYATVVFDAPPTGMNITQTSELVLQKNKIAATAVTQVAEMILQKTDRSPYRVTQVSELFLVSETPTVFWLNFGTLQDPVRFQLYNSDIGRASSVPVNCTIQIEGFYAEGTELVINDVPSGIVASVQNNDRVYIHGGITNYWQTGMPVYAYYEENGETARMLVGNWIIEQPVLLPKHTQVYYGSKITPSWIKAHTGFSAAALQSFITKALAAFVQLTTDTVHNLFGSFVDLLQEKTGVNTRIAEVTIGWDTSKALAKVSDTVVWDYVQVLSSDVSHVSPWGTQKAQISEFKQADFIDVKAAYGDVDSSYEIRGAQGLSFYEVSDVTKLSVNYGSYVEAEFVQQRAGYANVDAEYVYVSNVHQVHYTVIYIAVPSSSNAVLYDMEPISTKAYSVLSGMLWDRSVAQGTGHWVIPTDRAMFTQAQYGLFAAIGVDAISGHSEYSQRESIVIHGPQLGYAGMNYGVTKTYSEYTQTSAEKTTAQSAQYDAAQIKTKAQYGTYNLAPFLDMQSVNSIGPASLYKGFDTLAEVQEFTENFSGVHTALKYNGYVYTLDVDKSFICEIFNNGPVKWLLQGG